MNEFDLYSTRDSSLAVTSSTTSIGDDYYYLSDRIEALEASLKRKTEIEVIETSCKNCGAKVSLLYSDQIIRCPYCRSVYIIGNKQINST